MQKRLEKERWHNRQTEEPINRCKIKRLVRYKHIGLRDRIENKFALLSLVEENILYLASGL